MQLQKATVLFYEENKQALHALLSQFEHGYQVFGVTQEADVYTLLEQHAVQAVVCSQQLAQTTGVSVLRNVRRISPQSARILLVSHADLAAISGTVAEEEIYRYVTLPWRYDSLARTLENAAVFANHVAAKAVNDSHVLKTVCDDKMCKKENILIIDDGMNAHDVLYAQFAHDFHITWAKNIDQVIHATKRQVFGVILSDAMLNGVNILNLLASFKEKTPQSMIILLTHFQETARLAELVHTETVFRCLPKSVRANFLEMSVQRAIQQYQTLTSHSLNQPVQPTKAKSTSNRSHGVSHGTSHSTIAIIPNRIA